MTGVGPVTTTRRIEQLSQQPSRYLLGGEHEAQSGFMRGLKIPGPSDGMPGPHRDESIWPDQTKWRDRTHRDVIHDVSGKVSDNLEPFDVAETFLKYNKRAAPFVKPIGKFAGPVGYVADLIEEATADKDAPRPNYLFEEGDDLARRLYKGTALTRDVLTPMAGAAWATSLIAPQIMGPIMAGAGIGAGASWLGNSGVSQYCKWTGRKDDCS